MKRKYVYKNAVIYILNTDINYQNIHKATEKFLNKVIKENSKWNQKSLSKN